MMKLRINADPLKILHLLMVGLGNIALVGVGVIVLVEGGARGERYHLLMVGGGEKVLPLL